MYIDLSRLRYTRRSLIGLNFHTFEPGGKFRQVEHSKRTTVKVS